MVSSKKKNTTSSLKKVVKTTMLKLTRLWPRETIWKSGIKLSKRTDPVGSISAPLFHKTVNRTLRDNTLSEDKQGGDFLLTPHLRTFSLHELKVSTRNFRPDTVLGEGGFGIVYKGLLKEKGIKSAVAIKKLNHHSEQGFREWQAEVHFLGRIFHPNLVKLLGYCLDKGKQLLVYEYMAKGSLERHVFSSWNPVPLPWDIRLKILIGAARGLAFLHSGGEVPVIHRDIKVSNILLDESYNAKLSDFGLAKRGPDEGISHVSTRIMGTSGYAAPEYVTTGHLTIKSDVYSFGVVLIEMLTGQRVFDLIHQRQVKQYNLVDWIKPHLSNRRKLNYFMDPRLDGKFPANSAIQIVQLCLNCLEGEPKKRPSSQKIVETLEKLQST